jgi:hypothetical protein
LNLKPSFGNPLQFLSVRIPRLMSRGNCLLAVKNVSIRTKATLPITLRIK